MKLLVALLVVLGTCTAIAQTRQVTVLKYDVPQYPVLARTARVEGDVALNFLVGMDGTVTSVRVVSGPALLRAVSLQTIKQWKFQCLSCSYGIPFEHQFVFSFRLDGKLSFTDKKMEFKLPDQLTLTIGLPVVVNTVQDERGAQASLERIGPQVASTLKKSDFHPAC